MDDSTDVIASEVRAKRAIERGHAVDGLMKPLFVVGVGRSGTTVFARILNAHSQILVGIERYKYIANQQNDAFGPQLFTRERFFDVHEGDTNVRQNWTAAQRERWAGLKWIGDKVPHLYRRIGTIRQRFPGALVLCMLRDGFDVASSWHTRAMKETDTWPRENDYFEGLRQWDEANRALLRDARLYRGTLYFVSYEKLFGSVEPDLTRLLDLLEAPAEDGFLKEFSRQRALTETRRQRRHQYEELRSKATIDVDEDCFSELLALSVV
jgi:Sulfotransferase family